MIHTAEAGEEDDGYAAMAKEMMDAVKQQPGFLGVDSVHGLTVSYFKDLDAVKAWKQHDRHTTARAEGRARWYEWFHVHVARVERSYSFYAKTSAGSTTTTSSTSTTAQPPLSQ